MPENLTLDWHLGIDNVSPETALPIGAVADLVNADLDHTGGLVRRAGCTQRAAGAGMHDLWTSPARGESFAVIDSTLCRVQMPWTVTPLWELANDAPFSFEDLNGDVIASSRYELLAIAPDFTVRRLGLEVPGFAGLYTNPFGGLAAGRYGVAMSFVRGAEEGPLSPAQFVDVPEGGGFNLGISPPAEALPTGTRIYRTQANDDVLRLIDLAPIALRSLNVGITPLGRPADNQFLARMPGGDFVRYWKGRLWVVRGATIYYSEALRYGLTSPRFNFVAVPAPVRLFEPVAGGIYVGTKAGVQFLTGATPKDFQLRDTDGAPPIKGSGTRIPAHLLGEPGDGGEQLALWIAANGFVVGTPEGRLIEPQRKRIALPATGTAAVVIRDRQVLAVVS